MSGAPRFRSALFVLLSILAGALVPLAGADAQPTTLVVTGYGGRWSDVMKKALVEPFEKKHGVKVEIVTGITTEWVAKLLAAGPDNPPYDVVFGNEPAFPIPRERGFFDKRNEALAPNIKNLYPKALIGDTSLAMFWGRIGLAYRTDSGLKRPVSWKDFWDEAYVGKRATYVIGNTLGINFLFMISKIYGKDYFDIDAGVAAIKRAQPKLVDFTGTVEKQLEQKEVVIAVLHDAGSTYDLQKRGHPGGLGRPERGSAHPRPDRAGHARLQAQGARVEVHRRLPLARGAARLRHRALLEPDQQDGQGARRTWRRRSSTGPPTSTSSCSSTGRRWPSSVRSGRRSGTRRCVDATPPGPPEPSR